MTRRKEDLVRYWKDSKLITDEKLLNAFSAVPREAFILPEYLDQAYGDYPLPIGHGQTISQPTTVMLMIQTLELRKTDKVLEVGAGSGYCAAIMSRLCKKVITTEIIPELCNYAKENILRLKLKNVEVVCHDGSKGYEKEAPYDKIMVTAACPGIPDPLIAQLKENGVIVAPVGGSFGQEMIKGIKKKGKLMTKNLGEFMFVPLKGEHGF
ncbi:protein-L-isoaspartate(D-aspartate) O-methyltransferase [Candidatus Woesearchaeota archaeon]|nr:protein-L-isoaspartate(D-aspartate) O-methyltransferase [Candidatus Woesearchaeota archaeon]